MNENCFCHLNGIAVKDAAARELILQMGQQHQQKVAELENQLAEKDQRISTLEADNENKDEEIAQLQAQLSTMQATLSQTESVANEATSKNKEQSDRLEGIEITLEQTANSIKESDAGRGCYKDTSNTGGWWNPAMQVGVEYKTTEWWNEKPVYTKLVNCGKMPSNSEKWVDHNCAATAVLRAEGQCGNSCFPRVGWTNFLAVSLYLNLEAIGIYYEGTDRANEDALVQIWYVKD